MVTNNSNQVSVKVSETNSKIMEVGIYDTKSEVCFSGKSSMSPNIVTSTIKDDQLKPSPSRIDYNFFNYWQEDLIE